MTPDPKIAVVIPTFRRETRLRFALEAIARQTLGPGDFETIVVRAPDAAGPLAEAPSGLPVRFLESTQRGPAAQRNRGWRATRASLVAFTDDDCRPAPDWLERLLAAAGDDSTIVQGRTEPDPDERHLLFGFARTMSITEPGLAESCNIAYPRALLEDLGGFAEDLFPDPWGEDTDLGLRAVEGGAQTRFAADAVVRHAVLQPTFRRALIEARRHRWQPTLVARHPGIRATMPARVFTSDTHVRIAAGLVAATALRGRRRLLGLVPYVAGCVRAELGGAGASPRGLARLAAHLPFRASRDLVEVASTVEGSVRARTLVI